MDLDSVDDLVDANPINEETVTEAAKEWADDPPDEEFTNILEAKEAKS